MSISGRFVTVTESELPQSACVVVGSRVLVVMRIVARVVKHRFITSFFPFRFCRGPGEMCRRTEVSMARAKRKIVVFQILPAKTQEMQSFPMGFTRSPARPRLKRGHLH